MILCDLASASYLLSPIYPSAFWLYVSPVIYPTQAASVHSSAVKKDLRKMFPALRVTEDDVQKMFKTTTTFKASQIMAKRAKEFIRWVWNYLMPFGFY